MLEWKGDLAVCPTVIHQSEVSVMEWVQQLQAHFLSMVSDVDVMLSGQINFQAFQQRLQDQLQGLGREITRVTLESADDRLREQPTERPGWVVIRRHDRKQVMTRFGPVAYERTYFKQKATGRRSYLVDSMAGWDPHTRVDAAVKAQVAEAATTKSYRASGEWADDPAWSLSGQAVMNAVREVQGHNTPSDLPLKKKRRVKYLYVEADEDHVANQDGPRWQPRLVYVHEGRDPKGRLRNVHYIGGLYRLKTEELWNVVWRYLDETYDLEAVEKILLSGDGAGWIRQGCEYIPESVFLLDRYHVQKYVTAATGTDPDLKARLWRALYKARRKEVIQVLGEAEKRAAYPKKSEAIADAKRYLLQNWDGIRAWKTYEDAWFGCSAEGHISHVYADRMSSRPMAWSERGVDQMARLRTLRFNGVSIEDTYLAQAQKRLEPLRVSERFSQELKRISQPGTLSEALDNLPAMRGRRSMLTRALGGLSQAS